jgi:hypothetical protein
MVANSVSLRVFEVPVRTDAAVGAARRWVGVMKGPTGAPLEVAFQAFLALKKPKFSSIWVEKRLRNG